MVSVTARKSPRAIVVSWVQPNCSDINDDQVNEYMIRYGLHSETQRVTTPMAISGTTFTITDGSLEVLTEYSIEVAAVNSMGVGQYSQPETVVIIDGEYRILKGLYQHHFSLQPLDL